MQAQCPHCGSEVELPPDTTRAVCESCKRAFSLPAGAETLTEAADALPTGVPTISQPKVRINCPRCNAELTVPMGQLEAACPRCGEAVPLEPSAGAGSGGQSVRTAKTIVTGRRPSRPEAESRQTDQASLRWLRRQLSGKYEVLSFVSRGGMGAVYRARQKQPSREVALKVMLAGTFTSPSHRKRFEREAQAVAMLKHPAVVPVYEYGEVGGQPYFTMEFVDGVDLRTYVRDNELGREQTCRLMVRVCDAIHYAHQRGVIHRDLKPGNIMVDSLERPRILDFGLSRTSVQAEEQFSALTLTGEFMGTPHYMSPEQALGRPLDVDERADVYALGIILYELIVGVLPYPMQHARGLQLLDIIRSGRPISPSALHASIPRDLEIIMLKAIEKDKEQRYKTAEALARDLESFLAGRPIAARPATVAYRLNRWAWRNRKVLTPVAALLLATGILTAFFLGNISRLAREKDELAAKREVYERYDWYDEGAKAGVEQFMRQGLWREARDLARFAPVIFPEEAGLEYLTAQVQRRAELAVNEELGAYAALLEAQDYAAARKRAAALGAMAAAMPYDELHRKAAAVEPEFAERCWKALEEAAARTYGREDALSRVDAFLAALPDSPHAEQAAALRAQLDAEPEETFLRRHEEAFDRALAAFDWAAAGRVLDSAQQMLARRQEPPAGSWSRSFEQRRSLLAGVIRQETAWALRIEGVLEMPEGQPEGERFVKTLAFSPDGRWLAVGAVNGALTVWNVADSEPVKTINVGKAVRSVAFAPDGATLAAGQEDGTVGVLQRADLSTVHRWSELSGRAESLSFSPDGRLLLSADLDQVALWEVGAGRRLSFGHHIGRRPAALSPDGWRLAAYDGESAIVLWDVDGGYEVQRLACPSGPLGVAFAPDGSRLAAVCQDEGLQDESLRLWDADSGAALGICPAGEGRPMDLALSPDGRLLASVSTDKLVRVFTVDPLREVARLPGHAHLISAVAFSPDCRLLASGGNDARVLLWAPRPEAAAGPPD